MVNPAAIFPKGIAQVSYVIRRRREETHDVIVVDLAPQDGSSIPAFRPGQFVMVTLYDEQGIQWQRKAYSIASSPTQQDHLEIGFKLAGEFTHRFITLREGDRVGIDGPYGLFTFDEQRMPTADFFAGGIGITPFLSMIRYVTDRKLPNQLTLLYMNKTRQDISYFDELQSLTSQNEHVRVIFGVDQIDDPAWTGERGLVTPGMIERSCRTFAGKTFFLCGPKPFMDVTRQHLLTCGVASKDIKTEVFT